MKQNILPSVDIESFVSQYLQTAVWAVWAVWADLDENDTKVNLEFTEETKITAYVDCLCFFSRCLSVFGKEKCETMFHNMESNIAHNFWLTRQHHGAGFWDSPTLYGDGEESEQLTKIAQEFPELNLGHVNTTRSKLTFY